VDGVAIVAHVTGGGGPRRIILEAQFRPPQGNTVIEVEFETVHDLRRFCARSSAAFSKSMLPAFFFCTFLSVSENLEISASGGAGAERGDRAQRRRHGPLTSLREREILHCSSLTQAYEQKPSFVVRSCRRGWWMTERARRRRRCAS